MGMTWRGSTCSSPNPFFLEKTSDRLSLELPKPSNQTESTPPPTLSPPGQINPYSLPPRHAFIIKRHPPPGTCLHKRHPPPHPGHAPPSPQDTVFHRGVQFFNGIAQCMLINTLTNTNSWLQQCAHTHINSDHIHTHTCINNKQKPCLNITDYVTNTHTHTHTRITQ